MTYAFPAKDYLDRKEAAAIFGVTPKCLRDWERAGRGPPLERISRKVARYPVEGVKRFLEAARRGGMTAPG